MKILAVDGNFYMHRFHSVLSQSENVSRSMCHMFVNSVCRDALANRCDRILVAFDGSQVFRHALYSDYKASRTKKCGTSPYDYLQDVKSYLSKLGIPNVQLKKYEADDILASVATQNQKVVIATKDKDAYQYLRPGIILWDATHKPEPKVTKDLDVKSKFGVEPSQCVEYQTLVGDGVDTIPSVIGQAKAKKGLAKWGTIKNWAANDEAFRALVIENLSQLKRNQKLVTLVKTIKVSIPPIEWNKNPDVPTNYIKLKEFCSPRSKGLF